MPGRAEDVIAFNGRFLLGGFSRDGLIGMVSQDGYLWQDVTLSDNADDQVISAFASGPDGVVVLMEQPTTASIGIGHSLDGVTWARTNDDLLREIGGVRAVDVEWVEREFVALGSRPSGGDDPTVETLAARSRDGIDWEVARSPDLVLDLARAPVDLTVAAGRPVALATTATGSHATFLTGGRGAARWRVDQPQALQSSSAWAIVGTATGILVGGCTIASDETRAAAVWNAASPDGTWQRADLAGENACVRAFARLDDETLLALGDDGDMAAVWSSHDGIRWERQEPIEVFAGRAGAVAIAAAGLGGRWLVVGTELGPVLGNNPEIVATWRRTRD
jgi:hypothetical protein